MFAPCEPRSATLPARKLTPQGQRRPLQSLLSKRRCLQRGTSSLPTASGSLLDGLACVRGALAWGGCSSGEFEEGGQRGLDSIALGWRWGLGRGSSQVLWRLVGCRLRLNPTILTASACTPPHPGSSAGVCPSSGPLFGAGHAGWELTLHATGHCHICQPSSAAATQNYQHPEIWLSVGCRDSIMRQEHWPCWDPARGPRMPPQRPGACASGVPLPAVGPWLHSLPDPAAWPAACPTLPTPARKSRPVPSHSQSDCFPAPVCPSVLCPAP